MGRCRLETGRPTSGKVLRNQLPSVVQTSQPSVPVTSSTPASTSSYMVDLTGEVLDVSVPSPASSTLSGMSTKRKTGRPKDSPVWKYFRHDPIKNESTCLVQGCTAELAGKNTGNNEKHLEKKHLTEYKQYQKACEELTEKKKFALQPGGAVQVALDDMAKKKEPYDKTDETFKSIMNKIAVFVLRSSLMSLNGVEEPGFVDLVSHLNARAPRPTRELVRSSMDDVEAQLLKKILMLIEKGGMMCLTTDGWTKKRISEAFLGITAQFVERSTGTRHHFTLSCASFPPPHTAENVYVLIQKELLSWEIPPQSFLRDHGKCLKHGSHIYLGRRADQDFGS